MIDEKIVPIGTGMTVDWSAFRREAAKNILVGLCANKSVGIGGGLVPTAIALADELIKQLKDETH